MNMKISFIIISVIGFASLLTVSWLWKQIKVPVALYEVQSDTGMPVAVVDTKSMIKVEAPIVVNIPPPTSITKDGLVGNYEHVKKTPVINLDKEIFRTRKKLEYWDKEQRTFQLYSPPFNSKAKSGWTKDYNAAKSHKKYYRKKLDKYNIKKRDSYKVYKK